MKPPRLNWMFSVITIVLAILLVTDRKNSEANGTDPSDLVIGVIGDQTGSANLDHAYEILGEGADSLNAQGVDVVLHAGDLVESTAPVDEIRRRFLQATTILDRLNSPWYLTAGDHDVNPTDWTANSQDHSRETLFRSLYSAINPAVSAHLWYSFDLKGYHFVVLNSQEHLRTDPRWGNIFYARLSDEQYAWLELDLNSTATDAKGVVVLLHQPLWYNWAGWVRVHHLLASHRTLAVIAGHTHYNQIEPPIDGIQYLIVGATGADTKEGSENAGNLQHTTVLRLNSGSIDFKILPLHGYSNRQWSDRSVMDGLQAIDVSLSNLAFQPMGLRDHLLYQNCTSNDPAKLTIQDIGNPIDLPLNARVDIQQLADLNLSAEHFVDGLCEARISDRECVLIPSANVVTSNNSIVQNSYDGKPAPLWTADLTSSNPDMLVGKSLPVDVTMSLTSQNITYAVKRHASATFEVCK